MFWTLVTSAAFMQGAGAQASLAPASLAQKSLAQRSPARASLEGQLRSVAALRGEPSLVSAAGLTRDSGEVPILTLENAAAFDRASPRLRLVLVGFNRPGASAVLAFVRWFKTAAGRQLRRRWSVTALPWALVEPADRVSLERWVTFQVPDLLVQVRDDDRTMTPSEMIRTEFVGPNGARAAILKRLRAARAVRSTLHEEISSRLRREPLEIARLLADRYPATPSLSYIPAVAWTSTLRLAAATGDRELTAKVRQQSAKLLSGNQPLFSGRIQLTSIAGAMVFADLGGDFWTRALDAQRLALARKEDGTATYGQGWTDDMFMATSILARVGRDPAHTDALDAATRLLVDYARRLQRTDGIFIHATEGPFAWGRGNGFAALGLMEALEALPEQHSARGQLLEIFQRLMAGARAEQAPDGMWREVLDEPGAYREATATAMLMTAMARGVRRGWIDRAYLPVVQRAWHALAAHVRGDGTIVDVCASTGAGPTRRYYLDRPAITGADDRGGAMALLAAMEIYELSRNFPAVTAQ